jgi:PQQ-dependent catabolism-associated CXXCW motif protein
MNCRAFLATLTCLALFQTAIGRCGVPEPDGYRMEDFRSEVPDTLAGAQVLNTREAEMLWRSGRAVFIDVLPRPPKPKLPEGTVYQEKVRHSIPGSIWLANTGFGVLPPDVEAYFRDGLSRAAANRMDKPLVFFCLANCWMSWNAAKRAVSYGYRAVNWYPGGTDQWAEAGLPLEVTEPLPFPGQN